MSIYLDNAATTKPCAACIAAMTRALEENYGNPSSLHGFGFAAEQCLKQARAQVASALGCESDAVIFTSGATESNHLAIRGAAAAYGRRKKRVVTTEVEHASVRGAFDLLEEQGYTVVRVAPDPKTGQLDADAFVAAVDEDTCLVSMMLVNNETGAILPVAESFARMKRQFPQVITHCDAVQGFLKLPFDPEELCADLITVSGHKLHAAKGVGALYRKKGVRLIPLWRGGSQEQGLRAGTESVPLIAGFGAAAAEQQQTFAARLSAVQELYRTAAEQLSALEGVTLQSPAEASPYILSISVKGLRSETLLHFLSDRGIYVSSGSACSRGAQSGVLQAFGISKDAADSTLRVSFCAENTAEDISALCAGIRAASAQLVHKK